MTELEKLFQENGTKKVIVTYPDGKGNHETTVRDIVDRFSSEASWWKNQFFTKLLTVGQAETRFGGVYKLKDITSPVS